MPTVTVNWNSITHTVPDRFAFNDVPNFNYFDYATQAWRDMAYGMGAEGYRLIGHVYDQGTPGSPSAQFSHRLNAVKYLIDRAADEGRTVAIGYGCVSGPATLPSHADPRSAGDLQTSGTRSPSNGVAWLNHLKNVLGITVEWMEFNNEPGTQVNSNPPWWSSPVTGYTDLAQAGNDWAAVHMRQFFDPIIANPALHGTTRLNAGGGAGNYDGTYARHMHGVGLISSTLLTDSNINHFDGFSEHAGYGSYRSTSTQDMRQSTLNNNTLDTAALPGAGHSPYNAWRAGYLRIRNRLNFYGGSSKTIDDTEWQPDGGWVMPWAKNWMGGLKQTVEYIQAFNLCEQLKLKSRTIMDLSRDPGGTSSYVGSLINGTGVGTGYQYTVRANNLRQQVHPYSRRYKRQVSAVISGNTATPGGALSNPSQSVWCAAGIDEDGNGGMLMCNINLTSTQAITVNMSPSAIADSIVVRMPQSAAIGVALATSTLSGTSSLSLTLAAGEVVFIEVPVGSTGPAPPTNIGVWSAAAGWTAGTIGGTSRSRRRKLLGA